MVNKKTTTLVFALGAVMVLGTLAPQLLVMVQTAEAHGVQAQLQSRFIKIEDETFNLKLDKVDFIEIEPFILEREKEYLHPYQLHKASINGSLRLSSNKQIRVEQWQT